MPVVSSQGYSPLVRATQLPIILSTGSIGRYPYARQRGYATKQVDFADFSRQSASLLANPLMRWDVTLSQLTDQETAAFSQFFDLQKGSAGTFTFVDPWDNLLQQSEVFSASPWVVGAGTLIGQNYLTNSQDFEKTSWVGTNSGTSNPVVTADAQVAPDGTLTADTIVFPAIPNTLGDFSEISESASPPTLANMPFTFSVWLKVASGTGSVNIQISDVGISASNSTVCALTTSWQRFSVSVTFGSVAGSFVQGTILNPQNSPGITVWAWGAQVEYGRAPSDYTATTTTPLPLAIADPFFVPAPSIFPGYQWNLNSAYPKRGLQMVITDTTNPLINQTVPLAPSGVTFTGSIYAKAQDGAAPNLPFQVADSGFNERDTISLAPAGDWARSSVSFQFSNSNPKTSMIFQLGGNGTSARGVLHVFGAQLDAGIITAYKKTSAVCGVHSKCYIMSDEYSHIASEFDVNAFENSMRQRQSTLSSLSDVLTICESN